MRIEVRLYATLRRFAPAAEGGILYVDMPGDATPADVIATVKVDPGEVHIVMVNGRSTPVKQPLAEGDRLGLFPPIGGG